MWPIWRKGAPGGALSFLRAGVVASEKRENLVREPLIGALMATGDHRFLCKRRGDTDSGLASRQEHQAFPSVSLSHSCNAPPSAALASSIPESHALVYVLNVKPTVECPASVETILGWVPARASSVQNASRRLWSDVRGSRPAVLARVPEGVGEVVFDAAGDGGRVFQQWGCGR